MRLLDRLLSFPFNPGQYLSAAEIEEDLSRAQLVVADNVVRYVEQFKAEDIPTTSDFPNVMLPFEKTFIEMRYPTSGFFGSHVEESGVLLTMVGASQSEYPSSQIQTLMSRPGIAYCMIGYFFMHYRGKDPFLLSGFMFGVDREGKLVSDQSDGRLEMLHVCHQQNVDLDSVEQMSGMVMVPLGLTLSFMHCRNVRVAKETPPPKLSAKHQKRTGRPLLHYHILQIDHMKQILEREGGASTQGLKKALHICRGHFKHYGRDGKGLLFGKHVATVWISMHTRGSVEKGVVVKDYDVK